MSEHHRLEDRLVALEEAAEPLPPSLRGAILTDAAEANAVRGLPWRIWLTGLPAALAGLWLGLAQPALVLQTVPDLSGDDVALLEEVFGGASWDLQQ
ncbi:MAG: hypothetical protein AAF919_02195 [Pseudomonadota bacterium]